MADFTALATRYVLADDEDEQQQLAGEAAQGIKNAPRKSTAVLSWAQSINAWMPGGSASGDEDDNVIARAKALGFLAATLKVLDDDVLRVEQIEHLIAFFGAMFAIDHKAGILAAATALRCLCSMRYFRPSMAASVLQHMAKLGDDFRLQAAPTRLALYDLVNRLLADDAVLRALQQTQGPACSFLADGLLPLCRHERDPDNLLRWFATLQLVLERYDPLAPAVAEDVFKTVSDYFPISMRSAATPAGTTVDDLKTALRACFSASALVAASVLDFLLQKLDQGDALTVSVKVDILRTVHACVTTFARPAQTVSPHAHRIWGALKYEVRHGDVPESVDWTLRVIEALATTLNGTAAAPLDPACARDFVERVLADCINDLANPTYARPAGQLLTSTLRGGLRSFNLAVAPVLAAVQQNLQKAQLATYIRDLLAFLGDILRTRQGLVAHREAAADSADQTAFHSHDAAIVRLLDAVYLRLWTGDRQDPIVLAQIMNGLAELVGQTASPAGPRLCSPEQCREIFTALAPRVQYDAALPDHFPELAHEAMLALQKATAAYPEEFAYLVGRAVTSVQGYAAQTQTPVPAVLAGLRDSLARLAFIGCSTIPAGPSPDDRLRHFSTLTRALDDTLAALLQKKASFQLATVVLSGIYGALLNTRDALDKEASVTAPTPVWDAYRQAAAALVRQLYVRATVSMVDGLALSADFDGAEAATALDDQDQYLHQLASMATFVVRDLSVDQQTEAKLYEAPFCLFHEGPVDCSSLFHGRQGGRVDVLSLGILRGLHPAVVARLARVDLLSDLDDLDGLPQRTRLVRHGMATIVANKYAASPAHADQAGVWRDTVAAVQARLAAPLTPAQFARLVAVAAGAFARLDRDARVLAALLAAAPVAHSRTPAAGEQMARLLGQLVSTGADCLAPANHAVVKSVYKQWVYSQTVQPLLPQAFPRRDDLSEKQSYAPAIAVLALVRHMPFSVYEDDVEALVRILVAAATTLPGWADVGQALRVLQVVLEHRPAALQGHLNTLVDASMAVFGAQPGARRGVPPPGCRQQALQLVAQLPAQFDEAALLPYGPRLARALAAACGDRVRQIREAAQQARESWSKVPL